MAVGVLEIDAAAAVVATDFAGAFPVGIGPVLEPSIADAAEDLVEVVFADQEGVVLRRYVAVVIVEVDGNVVVERDDEHRAERRGARQAKYFSEERRRLLLVSAPNDRVVQLYAHFRILLSGPAAHTIIIGLATSPRGRHYISFLTQR